MIEKPAFSVTFLLLLLCPASYKNKITITDKILFFAVCIKVIIKIKTY